MSGGIDAAWTPCSDALSCRQMCGSPALPMRGRAFWAVLLDVMCAGANANGGDIGSSVLAVADVACCSMTVWRKTDG